MTYLQASANRLNWGVKHSLKFMMPCRLVLKHQCFGAVCCHKDLHKDGSSEFLWKTGKVPIYEATCHLLLWAKGTCFYYTWH